MEKLLMTTCIICPNGCEVTLYKDGEKYQVEDNLCNKGFDFAVGEYEDPVRMVTSTVKTIYKKRPRISVKTEKPISKELIFEVMKAINGVVVDYPVQVGHVLIHNVAGTGISVVATSRIWEDEVDES